MAAEELATRWKWAIAMVEVEWRDTASYGRIEPQPPERTPEEQAEIERLEARQAELAERRRRRLDSGDAGGSLLHRLSFADVLNEDTGQGYQRRFNAKHSQGFRRYIREPKRLDASADLQSPTGL